MPDVIFRSMRLGIGALGLPGTHTGMGTFSANVVKGLLRANGSSRAYALHPPLESEWPGRVSLLGREGFPRGWSGVIRRLLAYQASLPRLLKTEGISVFYSADHEGMLAPPVPQVVTLLDLIPLRFRDAHPKLRLYFRFFFPLLLRRTQGVVCISEATRRDLLERYRFPTDRTCVALLACDRNRFNANGGGRVRKRKEIRRYFLHVGTTAPHKNVLRIVEALARVPDRQCRLVLVGTKDPRTWPGIAAAIDRLGLRERIVTPERVPLDELPEWYRGASALVFPSLFEGFGLPALEAMACGCPVITSNLSSLPEVCADAALYVDPLSVDSIAGSMGRILAEPGLSDSLIGKGLEQAERFSWDRTVIAISGFLSRLAP